ncbi:putative bifunctional diguanylate cyclase/phosphodiesterase [Phyllobacterium endophyticum]|uniref:Diguanylate cyclase n=1 Tax=Phyllobacterium endophyticum TaxID=1149773 RepID=A0A2P7ALS8_9HYPH|nr:GGDEF domain-containing phosphodiesterase [Phyllobacterium endophyticum]MBB3236288.1 diguanylate cyclase (GGDEF)-like protein [Phyllobacterium endophyticum]PSH55160.1 diguanylate cyclase [Phyllobacterium endophyticum]TYR39836.1 EAL domain-containing protein [Phyllobacterium endophyticum]
MRLARSEWEFQSVLRRLELALDASQIGVWEHNAKNEVLWDLQMHRLYATGKTQRKVTSDVWVQAIHPDDRERAEREFEEAIQRKGDYSSEFRIILLNGDVRYLRSRAHYYEDGETTTYVGAEWDVTADVMLNRELTHQKSIAEARAVALEASTAQIEYAAEHDYLTGLPNRRYFDRRFSELSNDPDRSRLAILHVDLDYFKQVNDTAGHAAGDAVLKSAALMIASVVPVSGFVARMGGDEFVVLLPDFDTVEEIRVVAQHIVRLLKQGVSYGGSLLQAGASIGVAWMNDGNAANLLAESDIALYRAKKLGRNRVEFFAPNLKTELSRNRRIAEHVKLGLERDEFVPFYQIQVDARTGRIAGIEALARWKHPQRGILLPEAFLKVTATLGLLAELDAAILRRVLRDREAWESRGIDVPRIAVNTSAARLSDPALMEQIKGLNIQPGTVSFELLETVFLDDIEEDVMMNISALRQMGIDIEVDDFGSGHASIIGLLKLKPQRLKIDQRLVMPITTSREQRSLIRSIVDIARALGIDVIAEGVETLAHVRLLRRLGCDTLQGNAIAFPVPGLELFDQLVAEQQGQPVRP